jgi:predicted exporter
MNNSLLERVFNLALWLAGAGHFVILVASFQVPLRLQWKKDLVSLLPFNRKLLWVQGGLER